MEAFQHEIINGLFVLAVILIWFMIAWQLVLTLAGYFHQSASHREKRMVDEKEYTFPDFVSALAFVNKVGEVAEAEGHHPDIHLTWGKVRIEVWTHKIDGLTESDFILAAKIDEV